MTISYARYCEELTAIMEEVRRLLVTINPPQRALFEAQVTDAWERSRSEGGLRLVFVGEYNAGKSSLISALTGADITIDADVCTTVSAEYPWRGLILVDTPGIKAEGKDTNHDVISREATIGADLVLFVITTELFNDRLAKYLRFILDNEGLGLAKKTALIVNKFDRESNGEAVLRGEIQKVLGPHQDVPVYFCAASKFLQAKSLPDLQERFKRQSRIPALEDRIDRFVADNHLLGRLMMPLQVVGDVADSLQASVMLSEDDRKRHELIRRQKVVLQELQKQLHDVRKTWKQQAYSTTLRQAELVVEQIHEATADTDLDPLFQLGMKQISSDIERLRDGVGQDLRELLNDAQNKFDEIGQSPLARDVEHNVKATKKVKVDFQGSAFTGSAFVAELGSRLAGPLKEALEAGAKNAGGLRDLTYGVGKTLGKTFRPWEAVKAGDTLAKTAGKVADVIPYVAVVLSIYQQHCEEKTKEAKERSLAQMRVAVRNAFADQARIEADALEDAIAQVMDGPIASALTKVDGDASEIAASREEKTERGREIVVLGERCTQLRTRIMNGVR